MPQLFKTPFVEAAQSRQIKTLAPSGMSSAQWMQIRADLRERAVFSARVTNAMFLQKIQDDITRLAEGVARGSGDYMNPATMRLGLKKNLESIDYKPAPDKAGTIEDLSSDGRLNLIIDTNERMADGYGQFVQSQDERIIEEWPCQELVRVMQRKEPRNWPDRWVKAGGVIYGQNRDRMVARKDDPIWIKISVFGLPYPPFDFGSGMGLLDVGRDEAVELGVIQPEEKVKPQSRGFNDDLQMASPVRDQGLITALMADLGEKASLRDGTIFWNEP